MTIRILHVYRTYFPDTQGGLEESIRQICLNTGDLDVESRVLSLSADPSPAVVERPEATVVRARRSFEIGSCGFSVQAIPRFRKQAAWADVIHYHYPWPFGDVLHFLGHGGKPTLLTYHSDIVRQRRLDRIYSPLRRLFLASIDRIVCTSPNYFATSKVLPAYGSKVEVVPIGLEESSYPDVSQSELEVARREYGSDFFLFVGVLRHYKGLHILLEAAMDAPFQIVIAGSGPTERELKRQAARLGLTNIRFLGHVDDRTKVALYRLSRAVVFPSYLRSEAFGVTLLEGAMYARALISTEIGTGTSHVNIDGETGMVVPPGAPEALRAAMDRLHQQPETAANLGRNAQQRFRDFFTGRLMGQRYYEIYHQLIDRRFRRSLREEQPVRARQPDGEEAVASAALRQDGLASPGLRSIG